MAKIGRTTKQKDYIFLPGNYLLSATELFVDKFYPQRIKLDIKDTSHFVLNALAFTDTAIFTPFAPPDMKSLQGRIKSDVTKLKVAKYQPSHLFYFIDGKLDLSEDQLLRLGNKLSSDGYYVTVIDEKSIIERLLLAHKSPPEININELGLHYETLYRTSMIEHSVLEEIFSFLNTPSKDIVEISALEIKLELHLSKKIFTNFTANNLSKNYQCVKDTYNAHWTDKECVEYFIKQNYHRCKRQLYVILDKIKTYFKSVPLNKSKSVEYPVTDPVIFDELTKQIIPPEKHCDPRYYGAGKAIVLFFFEYCDFGKKSEDDPPTLFPSSNGGNGTTS